MGRGVSGDVKAAPKEKAEVKTDAISAPKKMEQAEPKPEPKADVNPPPTPPTVQALADDKTRSADNLPTCWGCGAVQPPLPAKKFQSCARCREDGLPPSHFCSKECFKTNWPRHKQWHAEQKSQRGDAGEADSNNAKEKAVLSTLRGVLKDQPKSDVKSYMSLMMEADEYKLKGSYTKAQELLNEAVKQNPDNPVGYSSLGEIQALLNQPAEAAKLYVKAVSLFPKKAEGSNAHGQKLWASSTLSAIFWLNVPGLAEEDKPEWFNDEELKELTASLISAAPADLRSWQTRAFVLCPMPDMPPQWRMPPGGMMRNEAELQEAGRCWQKVMQMTPGDKEAKRPYVARAAHCFRTAQMVAEQLKQNAAKLEAEEGVVNAQPTPNVGGDHKETVPAW